MRKPEKPKTTLLYESQCFPLPPEIKCARRRFFVGLIAVACAALAVSFLVAGIWLRVRQ